MKVNLIEYNDISKFEEAVNREVAALNTEGNKVKDIKFSTANKMGLVYTAMIIYETK